MADVSSSGSGRRARGVSVSLLPEQVKALDALVARQGVSRSLVVQRLIDRASESGAPREVLVDGVRFVRARRRS